MQKKTASEIKVGLLIALSLTILVLLLTNSANWRRGIGGKILKARFKFVSNLQLGAPVHMSGVEIGKVIDIDLLEEGVEVTMRIKSPQPVREGCIISIDFLGVVGETYVEIENGPPENPPLPDKAVVEGKNPISTATVLSKAEKAANTVIEMAKTAIGTIRESRSDLQDTVARLTERFDRTLSSIDRTLVSLQRASDELRGLASENREKLARITSHIDQLVQRGSQDYDEIQAETRSLLREMRGSITSTSKKLDETMLAVRDAAQTLESTTRKLDKRLEEVESQLSASSSDLKERVIEELDSLAKAVNELKSIETTIKETANRLNGILETVESGQGTIGLLIRSDETIRRAHSAMSELERAAQDTSGILRELRSEFNLSDGLNPRWDAGIRYTSADSLISQMAVRLGDLRVGVTMVGDDPSCDLQYVRPFRIGPSLFEARIGAIRSKAGAGFDWWWLSRRLGMTFDLSESGSRTPRIDTYLRLRLLRRWCLTLGGEDLAGERGFSAGVMRDAGWK
jgi:phospholipid/cholesterol/gamma-HCH transport system substrate-binding protein